MLGHAASEQPEKPAPSSRVSIRVRGRSRPHTHARTRAHSGLPKKGGSVTALACGTPAHTTRACLILSDERVTASVRAGLGMSSPRAPPSSEFRTRVG